MKRKRHPRVEDLEYKVLVLARDLDENARMEPFAKYALTLQPPTRTGVELGVENDIMRFVRKEVPRRLSSSAEILERMAEFGITRLKTSRYRDRSHHKFTG